MSLTRRIILVLALLAGTVPAFGQVPPPVPALPDTERRTSYSISASLCSCAVGFQLYGDSTDYVNWLEVFVNGVLVPQSGNWNVTSPTGPLATIPRPITDAVLTFTAAQTGTVQIVGARRPRRTTQFQESQPVPTRNFNQAFSDIISQNREIWDKTNDFTGRSVRTPPGETLTVLPPLSSRANTTACFDSGGNLAPCLSIGSISILAGSGITLTGTNPITVSCSVFTSGLTGCAPASGGGTANFLRADGSWAVPAAVNGNLVQPQGRVSLATGVAIMTSSVTAANTVYYTPSNGNQIPLFNGATYAVTTFTEVNQLTTDATKSPAAVVASSNYDIFCWNDTGPTFRCTRGPPWTSNTARGAGAGTSELIAVQGIQLNANAITNGPAAQRGTYVGTIRSNGTSTVDYIVGGSASGGTAAILGVWNLYSQNLATGQSVDSGVAYTYATGTFRQARASAGNQVGVLVGLGTGSLTCTYQNRVVTLAVSGSQSIMGIGEDTTSAITSPPQYVQTSAAVAIVGAPTALITKVPLLGLHTYAAIESGDGTNANSFDGNSIATLTCNIWN